MLDDASVLILIGRTNLPQSAGERRFLRRRGKLQKSTRPGRIIALPVRLVTYDRRGARRLGAIVGTKVVDLAGVVGHPAFPSTMEALIARPRGTVLDAARAALDRKDEVRLWTVRGARLLPPILPPSLAKEDHRWLVGPEGEVQRPPGNGDLRFDLEIAAVIYRPNKARLKVSDARACIFGYTLMQSWFSDDAFAASLGPCIVTADGFDAEAEVIATVNGRPWARGTISEAVATFEDHIVRAARREELRPGEVFGSGTLGRARLNVKAPRSGAKVEIEHPSIGVLRNPVGPRARRRKAS